ncbi:MAG: FISUMP domain-containing protein, partial [Bacteroidota bacterium]
VTNNNGCVARDTAMVMVDSLPMANHAITGPVQVCQGENGVTYSTDTLHFAKSYSWTLPPDAAGASATNQIALDFAISATSGNLKVHGINQCGNGPEVVFPVTVNPLPLAAGAISVPASICQGQNGVPISVSPVTNATSYSWSLPAGFTVVSGSGTSNILVNVALSAVSGPVTVTGHNSCGDGGTSTTTATVKLFPLPAGPITGTPVLCQGQTGIIYSVPAIPGAGSYIWTLPPGATVTAGSGTGSVTVSFDSTALSGALTVRGHSIDCGDGVPSSLAVTVNPLPSPAGPITGTTPVCQGQAGVSYSIPAIANAASYAWTLPPGCTILGGAGTNTITTGFSNSATSGAFTVHGHNLSCGDGRHSGLPVAVNPLPLAAGNISGTSPVCQGEPGISYSIQLTDPLTTSWAWNLVPPASGTLTGQSSTVSISWDNAFTGNASLFVNGVNGCGSGVVSAPMNILVNPKPDVTFLACNDLFTTKNAFPVILKGGYPTGLNGVYSGTGISQPTAGTFVFDPGSGAVSGSATGVPYSITYRYTNVYNCFREATRTMKVFSSNSAQPCPGTVTDVRDGKTYQTFISGSGAAARCWMAENLNYGTAIAGNMPQTDNCTVEKYCANDLPAQCGISGGFYQWDEMMNYLTAEGIQGLCMPGWHVPSHQEWDDLESNYYGTGLAGNSLKDLSVPIGFHGMLSGVLYLNNSWKFTSGSLTGEMFWSSTILSGWPLAKGINLINPSVSEYRSGNGNAFPVRCVKD